MAKILFRNTNLIESELSDDVSIDFESWFEFLLDNCLLKVSGRPFPLLNQQLIFVEFSDQFVNYEALCQNRSQNQML